MRIALDIRMLEKPKTGIGRYTFSLVETLKEFDKENEYLLIMNKNVSLKEIASEKFKLLYFNAPFLSWRTLYSLGRKLKKEKIDIYHSSHFLTPLNLSCPSIITLHDLMFLNFPDFFAGRNFLIRAYANFFSKHGFFSSLEKSQKIICISENTRKDLVKIFPSANSKIAVIGESINKSFKKIVNNVLLENMKTKFGIKKEYIFYLGNTRPYKNLPRLLKAFQTLFSSKTKNYQLVLGCGEERNLSALKNLAKDLNLPNEIIFLTGLGDDEIVLLMNNAALFVFPSLYEGFGLPPLEAMACGTPVVCSNVASLPEVVGDAAFLVNPLDVEDIALGMKKVLTDQNLRDSLIKKGYERVKLFSLEKMAKQTLEIYNEAYQRDRF
jgi:glycosyltransferase involved in cell wall biosynthesis